MLSVSSKNQVRSGHFLALSFVSLGVLGLGVLGCGGNKHKILTPEEQVEQQLAIEDKNAANPTKGNYEAAEADSEEAAKFDPEFTDHQLRLATLNAKDCPNSLPDEEKKKFKPGTANLKVIFQPDGTVKELVMDPSYVDTAVGACLSRAYEAIQIKPYTGEDQTLDWKVELKIMTEAEKKKAKEKAAKEAEAKDKKE
jgi:hypothetical protein